MDQISLCLGVCAASLRGEDTDGSIAAARRETDPINGQAPMSTVSVTHRPLDEAAINNIEKLLSVALNSLLIKEIYLEHYSYLLTLLPWDNRCWVAVVIIADVQAYRKVLTDVRHIG